MTTAQNAFDLFGQMDNKLLIHDSYSCSCFLFHIYHDKYLGRGELISLIFAIAQEAEHTSATAWFSKESVETSDMVLLLGSLFIQHKLESSLHYCKGNYN